MDTAALLKSVSDPSDFPDEKSAPGLRSLDHALRCNICGEFFDGPVTLPCGHGFCSLCIREHMRQESNCPMCRVSASESSLRKNIAMEEAVAAWTPARPLILRLVSEERKSIAEPATNSSTLPSNAAVNGKKRKRSGDAAIDTQRAGPSKVQKAKPTGDSRKNSGQSPKSPIRVDERDDDVGLVNTSDIEEADAVDPVVNCPMCTKSVRESRINPHIDSGCKSFLESKGQNVNNWLKIFPGRAKGKEKQTDDAPNDVEPERLPKASYGVLKEKKLREMLQEHKLPSTGDKSTIVARHQRWIMLYNANLDREAKQRKTGDELRAELARWEETKSFKKEQVSDGQAYQEAHKNEFNQMIKDARKRLAKKDPLGNKPAHDKDVAAPSTAPAPGPSNATPFSECDVVADSQDEV